jgi:hypothetical protein
MGRQAFIAHEVQQFDRYMAQPPPTVLTIFASLRVSADFFLKGSK